MEEATKRAIERMRVAADKAHREGARTQSPERWCRCEGVLLPFAAAIRILEEEHAKETRNLELKRLVEGRGFDWRVLDGLAELVIHQWTLTDASRAEAERLGYL